MQSGSPPPGSLARALTLILRRVAGSPSILVVTIVAVALTAGMAAAAARVVALMTAEGLRTSVATTPPGMRGLVATRTYEGSAATATWIDTERRQLRSGLDESLRAITTDGTTVIDLPRFVAAHPVISGRPRLFTIRVQPGFEAHARLGTGRLPRSTNERVTVPPALRNPGLGLDQSEAILVEAAVSRATADALRVDVGDTVMLQPDSDDPYVTRYLFERPVIAVRVAGIVALDDAAAPVWFGDSGAHVPTQLSSPGGEAVTVHATALVAPGSLRRMAGAISPIPVVASLRYPVEPALVRPENVTAIQQSLRRVAQQYPSTTFVPVGSTGMRTGLGQVLDRFVTARAATLSAVAVAGMGVAGVVLAVIVLLAALRAADRHDLDALLRARGASRLQMTGAAVCEAVLIGGTGAAGGLAAAQLVGQPVRHAVWVGGLSAAALAVLLLVPITRVSEAAGTRAGARARRRPPLRRITADVTIALLAVVGAFLVRQRGVVAGGAGADPFLVAVPILLGVAVGLVLLRLQPVVIGVIAERVAARRATVAVTGLRRAAREPSATALPVLAVTVAVATSVLTAAIDTTVVAELDRQAWMTVGAPARLDAPPRETLPPSDQRGSGADAHLQVRIGSRRGGQVTLLAISARDYADLVRGTPIATDLTALSDATAAALPAVTSPGAIGDVGVTDELSLPGIAVVPIEVRAVRERFPSLSEEQPFVVVPYERLAALLPRGLEPNRRYLPASTDATKGGVLTQDQVASDLMADPVITAGLGAFRAVTLIAYVLGALAVLVSMVLAARARRRDVAYLRTIGFSRRQGIGLLVAEVVPPLVVAIAVGVGLGTAIVALLGPGLPLGAMTGGAAVLPRADVTDAAVDGLLLATAISIAALWAGWNSQRVDLTQALRTEQR
jgi:putative ABC transport system permease protein